MEPSNSGRPICRIRWDMIYPAFNRLVVFNVTDVSNHGQPKANACPPPGVSTGGF